MTSTLYVLSFRLLYVGTCYRCKSKLQQLIFSLLGFIIGVTKLLDAYWLWGVQLIRFPPLFQNKQNGGETEFKCKQNSFGGTEIALENKYFSTKFWVKVW